MPHQLCYSYLLLLPKGIGIKYHSSFNISTTSLLITSVLEIGTILNDRCDLSYVLRSIAAQNLRTSILLQSNKLNLDVSLL